MTLPTYSIPIIYSGIDLIIALALQTITQFKQQRERTTKAFLTVESENREFIQPSTVAALYLFNPLTILSCVSKSTIIFTHLSISLALLSALKKRIGPSMFWIALASYLGFYPIMLLPALVMIVKDIKTSLTFFVGWSAILLGASRIYVGSWDFINATYGIM